MQIVSGHKYVLGLSGTGHKPHLGLSFTSHDFGPCALWQPGMTTTSQVLRLTNTDTQPIAVDPQLEGAHVRLCACACAGVQAGRRAMLMRERGERACLLCV